MTALEIARQKSPDLPIYRIMRYGCPDRYGIGYKPDWCPFRYEDPTKRPAGKYGIEVCVNCWNQKVKEA